MDEALLYSFRRCPYAMRARTALLISGVSFDLREVKLSAKPPELIAASEKGTVPVLILADGRVIDESLDIMHWALRRHDPERWLGGIDEALIAANDGAFKHHLDRYKYPQRYHSDAVHHRAAAHDLLLTLEARLRGQAYLCGPVRSFTDAATMPFVRQFAAVDPDWFASQALPHVQRWLAGQTSSALFDLVMARHEFWRPASMTETGRQPNPPAKPAP